MRHLAIFVLFLAPALAAGPKCDNEGVLKLVKGGAPDGMIVMGIEQNACTFDVGDAEVAKLKESGVSDTVIAAMKKKAAASLFGGGSAQSATSGPAASTANGTVEVVSAAGSPSLSLEAASIGEDNDAFHIGKQAALAMGGILFKKARPKITGYIEGIPDAKPIAPGQLTFIVNSPLANASTVKVARLESKDGKYAVYQRDAMKSQRAEYKFVETSKPSPTPEGIRFTAEIDDGMYAIVITDQFTVVWPFVVDSKAPTKQISQR